MTRSTGSPDVGGTGPTKPEDGRFPRSARITRTSEFQRVMRDGLRLGNARLLVWVTRNDLGRTRLGLVVGRKHGGAVQRNRLKRILREAFRLVRAKLPVGLDLACSPRPGAELTLSAGIEALRNLAARADRELPGA